MATFLDAFAEGEVKTGQLTLLFVAPSVLHPGGGGSMLIPS